MELIPKKRKKFQTALQLIQDPKGWEIIGEFLSNPDMIAQFTGDGLLGNLFGSSLSNSKGSESKGKNKKPNTGNN